MKYKLPKEFATRWLEALRSGDYKQAEGLLYDKKEGGYCCLGVACHMEYGSNYYLKNSFGSYAAVIAKDENDPGSIKFDLKKIPKELKGDVLDNELVYQLTKMNDNEGFYFKDIADWIEENVELYDNEET